MQGWAPSHHRFRPAFTQGGRAPLRGFTLIELLVVIVIVGIMAGVVVFYMDPNSPARQVDSEMDRLITVISLASDEAIAEDHELGLKIDGDSYRFLVFDDKSQSWQPYTADNSFKPHTLPDGLDLIQVTQSKTRLPRNTTQQQANPLEPDILLLSSGESSDGILEIEVNDNPDASQRLIIDNMANIKREFGSTGGV